MIYYVHLGEKSMATGADWPHFELKKISFAEAITILDINLNYSQSYLSAPKRIIPKIISNDSNLTNKFREVFCYSEFKKWCLIEIPAQEDREYYIKKDHSYQYLFKKIGNEMANHLDEIIGGKYNYASMLTGLRTISFTDEEGQTFYGEELFDEGWTTTNYDNIVDSNINLLYNWWYTLDDNWKEIFTKKPYGQKFDKAFIPSINFLDEVLNLKQLIIFGESSKLNSNSTIVNYEELDLKNIAKLRNLETLVIKNVKSLLNIDELTHLKKLKTLNLGNTNISSITFVEELKDLEELNIERTEITDILPLYRLEKLFKLNINNTLIERLTPLKNLKEIELVNTKFTETDIINFQNLLGYKIEKIKYKY